MKSGTRPSSAFVATAVLLAAGLAPVAATPATSTRVVAEVTLASNAVIDGLADAATIFDAPSAAATLDLPSAADAIDIAGAIDALAVPGAADAIDIASAIGAFDIPGAADAFDIPGAAAAFDIPGLISAELGALQGLFNRIISLPFTLFNDVERLVSSLIDLNFGMAVSAAFSIPLDIVNYVIGLPGAVINTVYQMAVVIPGEFLFNFG